jgi:hypothetical protein
MTCARRTWGRGARRPAGRDEHPLNAAVPSVMMDRLTPSPVTGAALARQCTGTVLPTLGFRTLRLSCTTAETLGSTPGSAGRQRCCELILHPPYAQYPRRGSVAFIDRPCQAEERQQAITALAVMIQEWWSGDRGRSANAVRGSNPSGGAAAGDRR